MASGGSDRDAKDALSKLLQMGTISGLKPALQCALLWSNPTTLGETFSFARATKARFTDLQLWELLRSNPTTLGEAFFKARIIEARFKDERSTTAIAKATDLNTGVHIQDLELETKVLVDGKQDDVKVVKVVGVAGHQNSDEPNVLKGNRVIGVGVNENNKGVDKEVQYSVYTLHVLIPFLKCLNDKYIKKKKIEAAIQRRLWDLEIFKTTP
nr:JmjC domain-containing protein [Tanacetum cinerariifolium]